MKRNLAVQNLIRTTLTVAGLAVLSLPAFAVVVSQATPRVGAAVTQKSGAETRVLPPTLQATFYRSLAKDAGIAYNVNAKGCATLPGAKLTACFNGSGAHFTGASSLALHLVGYGRGQALSPVTAVKPEFEANRVAYAHGNLTEWWRVLPIGFEQGFTLAKRPAGHGKLTLTLAANGNASRHGGVVGWGKLRYGDLVVSDAKGKVVPATLTTEGDRVLIAVNDSNAVYPLTVDPLVWIEQKATAGDGAAGDEFGYSAAVLGATAVIGAPDVTINGNQWQGAAFVFTKSNGMWTQTQKLVASDGAAVDKFGFSVAISADSLLIGAPYAFDAKGGEGTVYAFTNSGGTWIQSAEFSPDDVASGDTFGWSIAISGARALISSPCKNSCAGAAYIFSDSGGTWSQVQELSASDPASFDTFGYSVALDGTTALVGASGVNNYFGAAYVFDESGGAWTQTAELAPSGGVQGEFFGIAVALQDGTALVGAYGGLTSKPGAAYVFTNSGGTWTQTQEIAASDGTAGDSFGESVALDGTNAIVGAPGASVNGNSSFGAAYVFTNTGSTWTQTQKLAASDAATGDLFGVPVVLTSNTALVGALEANVHGNSEQGAAYFYGKSDLGLAVSAPQTVGQGQQYVSQTIATNNASAASPAVTATVTVPAAASFVSASASQGTCSEDSGMVTCAFGAIGGNAGMATANVTLKATGNVGDTIDNTASIALATPPLMASAPTTITAGGACPDGYTEYDGSLNPGEVVRSPVYQAPGGSENAILTAPARFELYAVYQSGRFGQHVYLVPGNEVHRWGPKGLYMWLVRARDGAGAYTLCLMHP